MEPALERKMLQGFLGGVVALSTVIGALVLVTGTDAARWIFDIEFNNVKNFTELDSSLRFFGAIFLSNAAIIAWSIPRIERAAPVIQIAAGGLVLGAVGRLISAADEGWPNAAATILMALEASVLIAAVWQLRISRLFRRAEG